MRAVAAGALCLLIVLAFHHQHSLGADYDAGIIERIVDDQIYVRGDLGEHVFEPIGICSWCEEGVEVSVTFKGYTRATLEPKSTSFRGRPLQVLIIHDGRE